MDAKRLSFLDFPLGEGAPKGRIECFDLQKKGENRENLRLYAYNASTRATRCVDFYKRAMPEMTGFPFGVSTHQPLGRE